MNWAAFANPWMLAGLAAVSLPVLIHYLTRARPKRIAFPPFQFLVEACAGQQAVHRLRTFVLLAIRCLLVAALVLLFARPFLKPTGAASASQANRRAVLIVDASLSMRAVQRGVSLFARAQAEATDVLRSLESGSEAAVVLAGATPRPLLPALSRNIPALHDELIKARPTYEACDPAAALALGKRLLGSAGTIYLFSDFQESNWKGVGELPAGLLCRLRRVAIEAIDNIAITDARLSPAEPVAGEAAELICTVFNCSPRARQETVRLEFTDSTQEARVSVPAFGSAAAIFNVSFPRPGAFTGKASLQPDDLPEDNTRYVAVRVQKALQVLLVSDVDGGDRRAAAFFVSRALAPSAEAAPGLTITRRHSQDMDRGILETADVFVLVAPAMLSGEAAEIIERRVHEGARFMAFLDGANAPFLVPAAFTPPFQLQHAVRSESGDTLLAGTRKLFAEADAGDWGSLRFRRHFQNQVLQGRHSEVFLSYPDGSAALSLSPVGKGAAVFVNLPITPDGSDLAGSPLFPAVLHELLRALRRGSEDRAITPGNAWTLDVPTKGDQALIVSDPSGAVVQPQVLASGRSTRLALPPPRVPGLYLVKQAEALAAASAVNVDARESDTRPIALEKLKPGLGSAVAVVRNDEELLLAGQSRPLWPQFAAAAALLLALEMLLLAFWRRQSVSPSAFEKAASS